MALTARVIATAVVAHLDGISGIDAYLTEGPKPPRGGVVIVHPDGGRRSGSLGDPVSDLSVEFQTTAIGQSAEQALWVHDQIAARLWGSSLSVGDGTTHPLHAIAGTEQPVRRDDQIAEPIFLVTCSWVAHAQPD